MQYFRMSSNLSTLIVLHDNVNKTILVRCQIYHVWATKFNYAADP